MLVALTCFYHRYYDMTLNALAFFGLVNYRVAILPRKAGALWWWCVGLLVLVSFETTRAGWSRPADWLLTGAGLRDVGYYASVLLAALTPLAIVLAMRDARARGARLRPS
jgi:hypothetical protein